MNISNNILKHYLKNVYFITGTAYAGKSTTVKMLSEKYDMIFCGENYHSAVSDVVANPENQPETHASWLYHRHKHKTCQNYLSHLRSFHILCL